MPAPEIITVQVAGRYLRDYFSTFFDLWGRQLDRTWEQIKADFPNPILMGMNAVSFIFDIPFIPFQALLENFGRAMINNAAYYRRFVITGEDAFKMNVEFITRGTLRAGLIDQSLIDQGFSWLASRLFTVVSGGGLIAKIRKYMGIVSVEDVLKILKGSITRQVALKAFSLMLVFFSIGYGIVVMLNMGLTWNSVFQGLQQNNPRAWGKQRNRLRTRRKSNLEQNLTARRKTHQSATQRV